MDPIRSDPIATSHSGQQGTDTVNVGNYEDVSLTGLRVGSSSFDVIDENILVAFDWNVYEFSLGRSGNMSILGRSGNMSILLVEFSFGVIRSWCQEPAGQQTFWLWLLSWCFHTLLVCYFLCVFYDEKGMIFLLLVRRLLWLLLCFRVCWNFIRFGIHSLIQEDIMYSGVHFTQVSRAFLFFIIYHIYLLIKLNYSIR